MKANLVKRDDRWDLYNKSGHKIASTLKGCSNQLSIKNCEAIELGYDLDELVNNILPKNGTTRNISERIGFFKGFQKALELLKQKKFSEEDMIHAIAMGVNHSKLKMTSVDIIKSFEKTEWEVEILMQVDSDYITLNDDNGCLILKSK